MKLITMTSADASKTLDVENIAGRSSTERNQPRRLEMNYLLLLYGDESAERELSPEERRSIVDAHVRFHAGLRERGVLVEGKPLEGRAGAFTVRLDAGGKRLVTDGPFAETKEQIGSFYLVDCAGREEAVAIANDVPASPGLVVEAWPVAEM